MNPEEGYDHAWIYKESSVVKSSHSKKDNGLETLILTLETILAHVRR